MSSQETNTADTKELVKELKSADPEIGELINEEKDLLKDIKENEAKGKSTAELEETVEEMHEETTDKIKGVLKSDPDTMKKVQKLVERRLKEYGGIEKTLERLKNVDLNNVPRFLKKQLRKYLPDLISTLKSKKLNPEFIDVLEDLYKNVEKNLVQTKPKKWRFLHFRKKGGKTQKRKSIKGGNGAEAIVILIGWIAFLITCCCTGSGCIICGPLLVITFCLLVPQLCIGVLAIGKGIVEVGVGLGLGIGYGIGKGIGSIGNALFSRKATAAAPEDNTKTVRVKITEEMKETNDNKLAEILEYKQTETEQLQEMNKWKDDFKEKKNREPTEDDEKDVQIFKDYKKTKEWLDKNKYIANLEVGKIYLMNREELKILDLTPEKLKSKKGGNQTKRRRHK